MLWACWKQTLEVLRSNFHCSHSPCPASLSLSQVPGALWMLGVRADRHQTAWAATSTWRPLCTMFQCPLHSKGVEEEPKLVKPRSIFLLLLSSSTNTECQPGARHCSRNWSQHKTDKKPLRGWLCHLVSFEASQRILQRNPSGTCRLLGSSESSQQVEALVSLESGGQPRILSTYVRSASFNKCYLMNIDFNICYVLNWFFVDILNFGFVIIYTWKNILENGDKEKIQKKAGEGLVIGAHVDNPVTRDAEAHARVECSCEVVPRGT